MVPSQGYTRALYQGDTLATKQLQDMQCWDTDNLFNFNFAKDRACRAQMSPIFHRDLCSFIIIQSCTILHGWSRSENPIGFNYCVSILNLLNLRIDDWTEMYCQLLRIKALDREANSMVMRLQNKLREASQWTVPGIGLSGECLSECLAPMMPLGVRGLVWTASYTADPCTSTDAMLTAELLQLFISEG